MQEKLCTKCKESKPISEFSKNKGGKSGVRSICSMCTTNYHSALYKKNKVEMSAKMKEYYSNNKEYVLSRNKEYNDTNKLRMNEYRKNWRKSRRKTNDLFRLSTNIRALIGATFRNKNHKKSSKTVDILGCSIEQFKRQIESMWEPWMNWQNYGLFNGKEDYGWDLDHIIPMNTATNELEINKLNHHTNFQPLCSFNNRITKRANI